MNALRGISSDVGTSSINMRILGRRLHLWFLVTVTIAGVVPFGIPQVSQTDPKPEAESVTSGALPSFEVATVKPNHSGGGWTQINNSPGRFRAVNVTAKMLIRFAYNLKGPELSGGPSWTDSERFDIDAKANDNSDDLSKRTFPEMGNRRKLMVQSLLSERFQLKLTHQIKNLPVYALVVAKSGPKFHETPTPAADPAELSDQPRSSEPSRRGPLVNMHPGELTMTDAPMSSLADALSGRLGHPVIDETGLKGKYDLKMQWTADEPQAPITANTAGVDSAVPPNVGPSIFTALYEQLGLKLESRKNAVETRVIEHIEQPSPD